MRHKLAQGGYVILILIALMTAGLPFTAKAQPASPQLKNLLVELWPEYDRPEVLVIYRAELSLDTSLPTQLTFRLPGYITNMHAVAVGQNGVLADVNPETIEVLQENNETLLSFPTSSPRIQFEYYDPVILTRQNQTRQLAFTFSTPYSIETTIFEVQEPAQTKEFSLTPEPDNTFVGNDGLKYHTIQIAGLAPADIFELSATYTRNTTELSTLQLASNIADTPAATEPPAGSTFNIGYLLIGIGLLLFLAAGGWWWSRRRQEKALPRPPKRARPTKADSGVTTAGFCYRCGAVLREDANFCHACGAERRTE